VFLLHWNDTKLGKGFGICYVNTTHTQICWIILTQLWVKFGQS